MATHEKGGFSNAAMVGQGGYPQGGPGKQGPPPYGGPQYPQHGTQHLPPGAYYSQPGQQSNVVMTVPGPVLATAPVRENTPPPDTGCGLIVSILVLIFCAWPCGIGAIISNRKAKTFVDLGQHSAARSSLRTMYIWIGVAVVTGIVSWVIIGLRIKAIMEDNDRKTYTYYG